MLETKCAVVTGAASGMGLEIVRRIAQDPKYRPIYAVDKSPSVLTVFEPLQHTGIVPLQVDIRHGGETAQMFDRIRKESQRLDVLVNAAGTIIAGDENNPAAQAQVRDLNEANYVGQMKIMFWAETMMESWGGGTIINITSSKDYFPDPYRFEYMLSKMRFEDMSLDARRKHLANEDGVRIVVVKPGNTKTAIDHGLWTKGSNANEMQAVQGFNDWWRRTFGNDPKNVTETIYRIAEGEIDKEKVHIGLDAQLGNILVKFPPWRIMFFLGSLGMYELVKQAHSLRKKVIS